MLIALALVTAGITIYGATRPSEREELIEDMQETGFTEIEAEQVMGDLEQLESAYEEMTGAERNDEFVSDTELDLVRGTYAVVAEPGALGLPDVSVFTDEQIRTYTAESCAIAHDSSSVLEFNARIGETLANEPNAAGAAMIGAFGMMVACDDAADAIGLYD